MKYLILLTLLLTSTTRAFHLPPATMPHRCHPRATGLHFYPENFDRAQECATHYGICNVYELEQLANGMCHSSRCFFWLCHFLDCWYFVWVMDHMTILRTALHYNSHNIKTFHSFLPQNWINFNTAKKTVECKAEIITWIPNKWPICCVLRVSWNIWWRIMWSSIISLRRLICMMFEKEYRVDGWLEKKGFYSMRLFVS